MPRRAPKHKDYILNQWPEDLATNHDALSTPYPCQACGRNCKSVRVLRTHECKVVRNRERSAA